LQNGWRRLLCVISQVSSWKKKCNSVGSSFFFFLLTGYYENRFSCWSERRRTHPAVEKTPFFFFSSSIASIAWWLDTKPLLWKLRCLFFVLDIFSIQRWLLVLSCAITPKNPGMHLFSSSAHNRCRPRSRFSRVPMFFAQGLTWKQAKKANNIATEDPQKRFTYEGAGGGIWTQNKVEIITTITLFFQLFKKHLILLNTYRPAEHTLTGDVTRAIIPLFLLAKENSVITNVAQFGNSHERHQVFENNCAVHVKLRSSCQKWNRVLPTLADSFGWWDRI